ncbi:hypothetical protein T484DRAFT_1809835 [Baffinella frigidus]|nr:hypothetical protein T484DRAFT_1809835 [Cryptophyta sp. CCMP2293]
MDPAGQVLHSRTPASERVVHCVLPKLGANVPASHSLQNMSCAAMAGGVAAPLIILGAYYYTWYGVGEQWQVFPRPWEPTLGEYRSADPLVMQKHHAWAKRAGVT